MALFACPDARSAASSLLLVLVITSDTDRRSGIGEGTLRNRHRYPEGSIEYSAGFLLSASVDPIFKVRKNQEGEIMTRVLKTALSLAVLLGGLLFGGAAFGQASPTSGTIKVWGIVNSGPSNKPTPVLVTGVIGDYGTVQTVNSSGKPDGNGNYFKLTLHKGTFTVNGKQFNAAFSTAGNPPPDYNSTTCTGSFLVGPVPVPAVSGTGVYAGISGSVNLTAQIAILLPKTKSGSCNTGNNVNPLGFWGEVTGQGTVSY